MTSSRPDSAQASSPELADDLARNLHRTTDPDARMQSGVELAVQLIDGCDHAGITMVRNGATTSGASSDDLVERADALQNDLGSGPCVDVARLESRTVFIADLRHDPRWPAWGRRVHMELGVTSLLTLLLYTHDRTFGALNLYSDEGNAFTEEDFALAENVAAHLAVAVADGREIEQRGEGMVSRTVIGQAEGILMERYRIGAEEAFAFLRRTSQDTNRKLIQIAEELVRTRDLPQAVPGGGGGDRSV